MASHFEEGVIMPFRGYLSRRTGIFRTWERVEMEVKVYARQQLMLFQVPENTNTEPVYFVKFKSCDVMPCDPRKAKSVKEFLSIFVKFDDKSEIHHFIAENVVDQRNWMITLGARGHGLFSEDSGQESEPLESWIGKWDQIHPSLVSQQPRPETRGPDEGAISAEPSLPPAYDNVVGSMVSSIEQAMVIHRLEHVNISTELPPLPQPCFARRPLDDTFLPPYGPSMNRPVSVGFGAEIKLPEDFQQIYDPAISKDVFINHETKSISWTDPRPPEPPPVVVETKMFFYGDQLVNTARHEPYMEALRGLTDIRLLYRLAKKKSHGLVIDGNGKPGAKGRDMTIPAQTGDKGGMGSNATHGGHDGNNGGKGRSGLQGTRGWDAEHGSNASNMKLVLSGDPTSLHTSGDLVTNVYLGGEDTEHVVFVSCRGGDGGQGGSGGPGGWGGKGGTGGMGAKGKKKYGKNQRGGSGGRGGNGGYGGDGGRGGPGGSGADPGSGGNVIIMAYDARLLMLCEVDVRSGDGGDGGPGGRGGSGGPGGACGQGMKGGNGPGGRGRHGDSGHTGSTGNHGATGTKGRHNETVNCGSVLFQVIDPITGDTIDMAGRRYDLIINHMEVESEIKDNINEPNERVFVSQIAVSNVGDLHCPAGASLTFDSSDTINFVPKTVLLPKIRPQSYVVVTEAFTGRVKDLPSPNSPGSYKGDAKITGRVHMLNRTFYNGYSYKTIDVKYPIQLNYCEVPAQMGRGEEKVIEINVSNISSMPYGEGADSGGFIDVRVRLDRRLLPVPKRDDNEPYIFSFDPHQVDSVSCKILRIDPGSSCSVLLPVYVDNKAELYDRCLVEVNLYLRGKLIEYNHAFIRICPFYMNLDPPADVLFVTGPELSRKAFTLWQIMFDWLNISLDFWDAERYCGFSTNLVTGQRHNEAESVATWVDNFRGKTILCSKLCLSNLQPQDILSHFFDSDGVDQLSSMILMPDGGMWDKVQNSVFTMNYHLVEAEKTIDIGDRFSGKHLFKPSSDDTDTALGRIQDIIKKLEKEDPAHSYVLFHKEVNYEKTSTMKYSYGDAYIKRIPLSHTAGFYMTVDQNLHQLHVDNSQLSPMTREVPIGSYFAQVMLMLIGTASPKVRTKMIAAQKQSDHVLIVSPTGVEYSILSLLGMALETYVCFEASAQPQVPARLSAVVDEVCEHPNLYSDDNLSLYAHLAAQSYLHHSDIKQSPEACQQVVTDLYERLKLALTDVTGQDKQAELEKETKRILKEKDRDHDKQAELEKETKRILKEKDRVTFDVLLCDKYYICPHRFGYKDKLFNIDRALSGTRTARHSTQVGGAGFTSV